MENWGEFTRMFSAAFESQFHSGYRDFKNYWSHVFVCFLQNSFPIKIEMLNQTTHKNLSFAEPDIALIVPSDVNAIEPMACFENRDWEYALVLTSYKSKWVYQRKWLHKLMNQRHDTVYVHCKKFTCGVLDNQQASNTFCMKRHPIK